MREHYFPFATAPRFGQLREQMDRLFGDLSRSSLYNLGQQPSFPLLNVWEEDEAIIAEAEVPGVADENLEVVATGNELTIRGERQAPNGEDSTYHRRERPTGKFSRTVRLAVDIESSRVEASLSNGVLRVILRKAEAAQPRTIPVSKAQ
ncbi:MAG: Hsp20/alpha crystallin family protein [Planctomycetales bacterium]|nr:Hsp20/alpha crystallin family protein [Planctomycetales bacterium]